MPGDARDALRQAIKPPANARFNFTDNALAADIVFTTTQAPSYTVVAEWLYAVAAPFPTLADVVTSTQITQFWDGKPDALNTITDNGATPTLFVTTDTLRALAGFFGHAPAPSAPIRGSTRVQSPALARRV